MRLESLLNNIQEVLSNVKNLEMVAASLYFVVNNLPLGNYYYYYYYYILNINLKLYYIYYILYFFLFLGADQLAAAKNCHSQAQEWVKLENSENAKSAITKVCIYINVYSNQTKIK